MFVLTECWTNDNYTPPNVTGYLNQNDGVVVYVRDKLGASAFEPNMAEGNCLIINIKNQYSIVCSYRPSGFSNPAKYTAAEHLTNTIKNIVDTNTTITKISRKKLPLKPWITVGVVRSIRKRDKLHKKVKKKLKDEQLNNEYKIYGNNYRIQPCKKNSR